MVVLVAMTLVCMLEMSSSNEHMQEGVSTSNSDLLIEIRLK